MKPSPNFRPKVFVTMLVICALVAGGGSWITGVNFWLLLVILVAMVLVNGLVATIEDKASGRE